jgi:serine/threonine protein kinase
VPGSQHTHVMYEHASCDRTACARVAACALTAGAQPASPAARAGAGGAWPGAAELTRISASPVPDDTLSSVTVMHESISAALDDCVRVSDWETRASDHTFVATLKASNGKAVPQMVKIALDDDSLKRIGAEWLILNSLRQQPRSEGHFNVVSSGHMYIVASGKYRGRVAMLLHPHCEAGSLLGRDAGEEVDSFKELLLLLIGWAKGLAYLHANDILHGDVRVDHLLQHSMLVAPAFKVYESVGLICSLGSAKQLVYHRCRLEGTRPLQYVADENWGNHTMRWRQQRGLPQAGSLHYPDDTVDVRYDIFALAVAAAEAAMGERFDCAEPSDATLSDMAACRPGLEDFRDMLEVRQCRGARDVRTRILKRFQGKASPATIQEFCIVLQRCMSSDPEERMTLADVVDACDALAKNSI